MQWLVGSSKSGIGKTEGYFTGFLIAFTVGLGYLVRQSDFSQIIVYYIPFFLLYLVIFRYVNKDAQIRFFVFVAILLRFLLIFALPNLSDDIYRFIWDGRLLINGINPFEQLPSYYIEHNISLQGINQELYQKLNSPDYFTIYPPVAQFVFAVSCWIFPKSILGSAIIMKLFLFVFEIGSILLIIKLLKHFSLPFKNVLLYALNPLIIIEITGNLHFEGAMIFFFLLGVWLLIKVDWLAQRLDLHRGEFQSTKKTQPTTHNPQHKNFLLSALSIALSIASKLLPLIFLPFFIKRMGWKKSFQYFTVIGLALILCFIPIFCGTFINNFGDSLNLYFQKFEFNASIYYLARWIGFQVIGYNLIQYIGPALAGCAFLGIMLIVLIEKKLNWISFFEKALFAICVYLIFTTTVHPWYLSLPIVLCLFTKYRFPIIWSGLIFLTYINYSYVEYFENLFIVGAEYFIVFTFFAYEILKNLKAARTNKAT